MTDLKITKLCAEAMGIRLCKGYSSPHDLYTKDDPRCIDGVEVLYRPLRDDAQAMALLVYLVQRGRLVMDGCTGTFMYEPDDGIGALMVCHGPGELTADRIRQYVCRCVAKMQEAK